MTAIVSKPEASIDGSKPYRLTVEQFLKLYETGIVKEDERLELLDGALYKMSPKGRPHGTLINWLGKLLTDLVVGEEHRVACDVSIIIDDSSMPEPDIVLLKKEANRDDFFISAADVLLVIEISDSTLSRDLGPKQVLYAVANIPEYWVVDVANRQINRYWSSDGLRYRQSEILTNSEQVIKLAEPNGEVSHARIFSILQNPKKDQQSG